MNILLIGGTGNISTDCATLLHHRGHQVTLLTRGRTPVPDGYGQMIADRSDAAAMKRALKGAEFDSVINFIGFDLPDLKTDLDVFAGKTRQYIFISSATVYAKPHRQLPLTETSPLGNDYWDYAQKKLRCENWLMDQFHNGGFPVTIVRPSHTYSHRWFPNVVSSGGWTFASRLLAGKNVFVPDDGNTPWTLTATSDFAAGLAGLTGNLAAIGEAFHITSDVALTWNEIYAETAAALGVSSPAIEKIPTDFICDHVPQLTGPLRGDKANPAVFDNAKIKRFVPEFACRKTFAEGIAESVAWYKAHPDQQKINPQTDDLFDKVIAGWRSR